MGEGIYSELKTESSVHMLPKGLLKEYSHAIIFILRILDIMAVITAGMAAYYMKFGHLHLTSYYRVALWVAVPLTFIIFSLYHIYESSRGKSFLYHAGRLMFAVFTVILLLIGIAFFTKSGTDFSRIWFVNWAWMALSLLIAFRYSLVMLLRLMRSHGWNEHHIIIIGAGKLGIKLAETLQQAEWTGFRVHAFFDDAAENKPKFISSIPVLKTPDHISDYIQQVGIDEIWLALPLCAEQRVKEILHELRHQTITTRFALDIFGLDLVNHSVTELAGFPVLNIRSTPMTGMNRLIKAIEDRVLACIILLLISPVLLVLAMLVKLSSPGPVFFRQKRVGWNGKEFEMLKFRTMPVDAEAKTGPVWAKQNENRATKIGAFLRRTSLDELPQFINVLQGDMSIVGPRPERKFFVEQFKEQIPRYMQKHMVKAGITGWAQIHGWRGNTSLAKRIEYDLYYIENWSLLLDLKIIFLTIFQGFIHKNAY